MTYYIVTVKKQDGLISDLLGRAGQEPEILCPSGRLSTMYHVATPTFRLKAMKEQSRQYIQRPPQGGHVFQVHSKAEPSGVQASSPQASGLVLLPHKCWKNPGELMERKASTHQKPFP